MFKPKKIYYEKEIEDYELGRELLKKYEDIPKIIIDNHNNIQEMRSKQNSDFPDIRPLAFEKLINIKKTTRFLIF